MRYLEYDKWYVLWKLVVNLNGEIIGVMCIWFMVVGLYEILNFFLYFLVGKLIVKFLLLLFCRV